MLSVHACVCACICAFVRVLNQAVYLLQFEDIFTKFAENVHGYEKNHGAHLKKTTWPL